MDRTYDDKYSVVIPLYRSEATIGLVVHEVEEEFARLGADDYEIILVNDCSPDNVLEVAIGLADANKRITVLDLARNVGQSHAIMAGLKHAHGDYIIIMDDDLQTPGNEIGNLIDAITSRGDDIVFASYDEEGNHRSAIRRFGTRLNWWMAEKLAGKPKDIETNSFRIMRKFVRDAYIQYEGHQIYGFGIMFRITSKVSNLRMHHRERAVGESGFTLRKLIDAWVTGALSFSPVPLRVAAFIGFALMLVSVVGMVVAVIIHRFYIGLFWGFGLLTAIQLIAIGLLGEYVSRIFAVEVKLPRYTIRKVYPEELGAD